MGEKRSRREVALELKGDRVGVSSQPVDQGPPGILKGVELREDGGVMVLVVIKRVCVCVCACVHAGSRGHRDLALLTHHVQDSSHQQQHFPESTWT